MNVLLTLRIAMRALAKNKMRAGLTVLGVVIGIAAVTTMVSIGQSAGGLLQGQIQTLGTNVLVVLSESMRQGGVHHGFGSGRALTAADAAAIPQECPSVLATSPIVFGGGQIIYGNANWRPNQMVGVGEQYLTVANWGLSHGGFFTDRDIVSAAKVCIIGHTVVAKLFQTTNPLGQTIRIRNIPFQVVGVLESKGANLVGEDQDDIVICPFTTVRKRIQGSSFANIDMIIVSARSSNLMSEAQQEVTQLLLERHGIRPGASPDFVVRSTTELANILGIVTGTVTALLASIAGISLLVGGVGIMNIMLVSVTERTREIGIRMAVGARGRDILRQFLVEAVLLSSIGGIIGFSLGAGASTLATKIINSLLSGPEWPVAISFEAAVAAMVFAGMVGVFFGYYPARRASRLDPIEALRYE
jgi:putative ABC transport system permease protein